MNSTARTFFALMLALFCLPALAANDCPAIQSFGANDVQTGQTVTITWSYQGGEPQSQTLTGHDFAEPVVLAPGQTSYSYVATKPGEKHVQLSTVTACGTITSTAKYHVKQCNVVEPIVTVDQTSVAPGGVIHASIDLLPGYSVRWEVSNATTTSSLTGANLQLTATAPGVVTIDAYVSRGKSCEIRITRTVAVAAACAIAQPEMYSPDRAAPNESYWIYVPEQPGLTVTFAAHGAQIVYFDNVFVDVMAPATGSFSIDVIVNNGTCSRTFTRTVEVLPCNPTAIVTPGASGACGTSTVVAEFTGDAPFQGEWSDGQYFYTYENRIERSVTQAGTYTINWYRDNYCFGTVTGSAAVGASLPKPQFALDEVVDGWYYGNDTCPGLVRTARLTSPAPAGATIEWSIENGTIVGGQGTGVVQFTGGPSAYWSPLSVVFRNAEGCPSETATLQYIRTLGDPHGVVSVSASVIPLGGTATVTVTNDENVRGMDLTSSTGDPLIPVRSIPGGLEYEYRAISTSGPVTLTYTVNNQCGGTHTSTATFTVDGGSPVVATANVRTIGNGCNSAAYAEFTGVAPFTGTWSNGESFTTNDGYALLFPGASGTYTLVAFSDANGAGSVTGSATLAIAQYPTPEISLSATSGCPGSIVTATITSPVPEGASIEWGLPYEWVVSGLGTPTVQIRADYSFAVSARITTPDGCSPQSAFIEYFTIQPQAPIFDLYGVYVGGTTQFDVILDPSTTDWGFENSFGDTMEIIGQPQPNIYTIRYTSTHSTGQSNVRIWSTTACGTLETTRVMNVLPPAPTATLTYAPAETCGANLTVTFTGTAPFSGTWENGETFTTNDTTYTRFVPQSGYYYIYNVTDAYGTGNPATVDVSVPQNLPYVNAPALGYMCPGTMTVDAIEVPAGWEVIWYVSAWDNPERARIVSGQGTSQVTVEATDPGMFWLSHQYRTPEGCLGPSTGGSINVLAPVANPTITPATATMTAGTELELTAAFDGFAYESLNWETSNGDPIYSVGQSGMTFTLRYVSQNGPGTSTVRAYGTTICGQQVEATATITIE